MIPVLSDVEIYGNLTIDSSVSITGNLTVDSSVLIDGDIEITHDIDIDGVLDTDAIIISGRGDIFEWFRFRDKLWLTGSSEIDWDAWLDNNNDIFEIASASIELDNLKPVYIKQYNRGDDINDLTLKNTLTLLNENGDTVIPNGLIIGEGITIKYSKSETYDKNSGDNYIDIGFSNYTNYAQLATIMFYNNESNLVYSIIWNGNETTYYYSNDTITITHYRDYVYRFTFSTNLNNSITKAIIKKVIIQ